MPSDVLVSLPEFVFLRIVSHPGSASPAARLGLLRRLAFLGRGVSS